MNLAYREKLCQALFLSGIYLSEQVLRDRPAYRKSDAVIILCRGLFSWLAVIIIGQSQGHIEIVEEFIAEIALEVDPEAAGIRQAREAKEVGRKFQFRTHIFEGLVAQHQEGFHVRLMGCRIVDDMDIRTARYKQMSTQALLELHVEGIQGDMAHDVLLWPLFHQNT